MSAIKELLDFLYTLDPKTFPEDYIHVIEKWIEDRPKVVRNNVAPPKRKLTESELVDCKNGVCFIESVIDVLGTKHDFIFNPVTKKWIKIESPAAGLIKFYAVHEADKK